MRTKTEFDKAAGELPASVNYAPLAMRTMDDLRFAVLIELDLTEEGQGWNIHTQH